MNGTRAMIYIVQAMVGMAQILIGLHIVLRLFGANERALFVQWIYETSAPLLQPFQGMFPSPVFNGGYVLELSALFAFIIYSLAGYLLTQFIVAVERAVHRKP